MSPNVAKYSGEVALFYSPRSRPKRIILSADSDGQLLVERAIFSYSQRLDGLGAQALSYDECARWASSFALKWTSKGSSIQANHALSERDCNVAIFPEAGKICFYPEGLNDSRLTKSGKFSSSRSDLELKGYEFNACCDHNRFWHGVESCLDELKDGRFSLGLSLRKLLTRA
jgi:hypothetical protein